MLRVRRSSTLSADRIRQRIASIEDRVVRAGYFDSSGIHTPSSLPYAVIMAMHEFGLGKYPARPAMQMGADIFRNSFGEVSRYIKTAIISPNRRVAALEKVGLKMKEDIASVFGDSTLLESNHPQTVKRKGGRDEPLVETGELRDKLGSLVTEK